MFQRTFSHRRRRVPYLLVQDPGVMHGPTAVHDEATGPADDVFLHAPSTASSGRRLMTVTCGDSYGLFFSGAPSSNTNPPTSRLRPPSTSVATSVGSSGRVIQDGQQNLRAGPFAHIDFFRPDSVCRFLNRFIMSATRAEIAFSVRRHIETQCHRTQVRDFTEEVNRRFRVTILQFAIGGAHAAQRANSAFHTFRDSLPLPGTY